MDAFWCITIGGFLLYKAVRSQWLRRAFRSKTVEEPVHEQAFPIDKLKEMDAKEKRDKEIEELKKQGYTDELIAVIIPTINNGQ